MNLTRVVRAFTRHALDDAVPVGKLLGSSKTSDVVDAHIVVVAQALGTFILTSDPDDMQRLSARFEPTSVAFRATIAVTRRFASSASTSTLTAYTFRFVDEGPRERRACGGNRCTMPNIGSGTFAGFRFHPT